MTAGAGVVAEADADAPLRDVLAAALEAKRIVLARDLLVVARDLTAAG
ncbi:MAG TPA: hypothetical protein VIY52_08475 [Streptosporangiaceae bacterium]